tara:strand:+ start:402 stop:605 length:204 start_codon:yes stop_codon:yes gene_type:complete
MSRFRDLFEGAAPAPPEVFDAPAESAELTPPPAPGTIKEEVFGEAEAPPAAEVTEPEAAPEPRTFGM